MAEQQQSPRPAGQRSGIFETTGREVGFFFEQIFNTVDNMLQGFPGAIFSGLGNMLSVDPPELSDAAKQSKNTKKS